MDGTYNYYIVALSVLIAILASYSAINIASNITYANKKYKAFWLLAGAIVLGSGVWSMHFVGMLAFRVPMEMGYDVMLTILSMLASIIPAFIVFLITMQEEIKPIRIVIGGFVLGSGIIVMHYLGMEAMVMEGSLSYDYFWFITSIIIAYTASYAALYLFIRFRKQRSSSILKVLSALMMGIAICGMHYAGMEATIFPHGEHSVGTVDNNRFLMYGVTLTVGMIMLISWIIIFIERHILKNMAYEDTLTGLPNRNAMNLYFDNYRRKDELTVLYLDLDQFKFINDTLGHDSGDLLIKLVGERLLPLHDRESQVYRIGGDEFLLIMKGKNENQAIEVAETILQKMKQPYHITGNELYTTASIGISIGPVTNNGQDLLKNADTAMYRAKKLGKNRYCVYDEQLGIKEVRRMELEKDLPFAVANEQLFLEYQPKWDTEMNQPYGFEALLRWNHPTLGLVSPMEFIPIAEETGIIVPMTKWVMEEAVTQCAKWQEKGITQPISVNLSIRLFQTDNLVEQVEAILEKVGLDPSLLELEITETLVLTDIGMVFIQLEKLRAIGVRISLDDFGSGYSSIGLLDRIPLDTIKLDRLFMNDLETKSKQAIIQAIIIMAEQLNLDVIAEGIENKDQVDFLSNLGCRVIQGYYFGKPMKVQDAEAWMEQLEK